MKVGLIGAGGWGRNIARVLVELGALGGIADVRPEAREEVRQRYPGVAVHPDHRALLAADVPAVVIATPAATHYAVAREALDAGKHVFVEKPLALRREEAEELADLADHARRILMVGHLLLYQPAVRWIEEFLRSEGVGSVWSLHQERLNLGTVRTVENALWSLGVHDVAVLLHLVGERPTAVRAVGQAALHPGVEDDIHLHLAFPGGIHAHIHASWLWPEKRRRLTVVGSKAMLVYDELLQQVTLHRRAIGPDLKPVDRGSEVVFQGTGEPLRLEMEEFLAAVREARRPRTDGRRAVEVVGVIEEASRQLGEG
ncbi:MAG: Gfo/Idh/MocA family oxidoreductase [Candidatus Bipolaricaulis sibiricus]|uniref:Gfo/Idh/MocA family oxidoreductase n=1 Tax=Bipolaricaulis sibiricus TaxID=2501609 RepID=A0A410FTK1_BIPS1|nr:MAG: Gfo/Idh/MocA family oxidoreductase [Candidatus Bipolaricaulis sibiricus]